MLRVLRLSRIIANLAQMVGAAGVFVGLWIGLREIEESRAQNRAEVALDAIKRVQESIDSNAKIARNLINLSKDYAAKIANAEPFQIKPECHAAKSDESKCKLILPVQLGGDGSVDFEKSNALRFSLVKYLNAWDHLAITLLERRADCRVLYTGYVDDWISRDDLASLRNFVSLYASTFPSATGEKTRPAWASLTSLSEFGKSVYANKGEVTADTFCRCLEQRGSDKAREQC